jgi:tRNA1(Val) A37 N6-methylase TrmN6
LIADFTDNAFLNGALTIRQPLNGYRAGVDPVLLAASVPAKSGQSILELGCGVGVALLCLGRRVPDLALTGVELQAGYAQLAAHNAAFNQISVDIRTCDLRALPDDLRNRTYDHIIANPPYFNAKSGSLAADIGRETGRSGDTPLADWCRMAAKRCAPKGTFTMIMAAGRLPDVLESMALGFGKLEVKPIAPRIGRPAKLVLVRGTKGSLAPFTLYNPLILHEGLHHVRDGESYTQNVSDIFRKGGAFSFTD